MQLVNAAVDFLYAFPCDVTRLHFTSATAGYGVVLLAAIRWILK